jgi:glycosyltransferase involved in cell wall biosynthesis
LKLLRFRIIWTVHNVVPHEGQTASDNEIAHRLAAEASAIIVHSPETLLQLSSLGLDESKAVVIPHGNYVDHYGAIPATIEARRNLGIAPTDRVLLFFGNIRPYKGIEDLLSVWDDLQSSAKTLVIAGTCSDADIMNSIRQAEKKAGNIRSHLRYIPDGEVSTLFAACDGVCLPVRNATTSGSAILAASFGKPLIAPRVGGLRDIDENAGFFYEPDLGGSLQDEVDSFFSAGADELGRRSRAAKRYADELSWPKIAKMTFSVYRSTAA